MDQPQGSHRRAVLFGAHALVPGDPIRRSLDPSGQGVGFLVPRPVRSKLDRRS